MTQPKYYIIVARKNQVLLSFLPVRLVIDGKAIYPLDHFRPVLIPVEVDHPHVVISDGFHHSRPLDLQYDQPGYFAFDIVCAINDLQLFAGAMLLGVLYLLGFLTGFFVLKALSFVPLLALLFYYYFNRKDFLRVERRRESFS